MSCFLLYDSITLTLVVVLLLVFAYYVYDLRTNNIFRRIGMPGPAPIPWLGEMFHIFRQGFSVHDVELVRKYGRIVGVYEGTVPVIQLTDLDLLRKVLIKDSQLFINRRIIKGVGGPFEHTLLLLQDDAWKNVRSIVSPTFSTAKLKAMSGLMNTVSDAYNQRLLEYADKQEIFDCKLVNGQYTLDNIASCLFGIETNSLQNDNVTFINQLKKFSKVDVSKIVLLLLVFISPRLTAYLETKGYSAMPMDALDYVTKIVNDILARRREHVERRNDFIQTMVDHEEEVKDQEKTQQVTEENRDQSTVLKKTLSDKEIFAQALFFMIAGYETTTAFMSFFYYIMSTEPVIQEKVYEEIRQTIGDDEVTVEKLNQLHYLDMVISETLRMYPPFIRYDRVASTDYQLGNCHIPKGSIVSVPVYPIHHDPEFWPESEKFIPERFSATEKAKRHPMAFLPFGDGPRSCIGMRFALLEAKLAIVKALRVVEIQRCEKTEVPLRLNKLAVLSSKEGIWIRVTRRSE